MIEPHRIAKVQISLLELARMAEIAMDVAIQSLLSNSILDDFEISKRKAKDLEYSFSKFVYNAPSVFLAQEDMLGVAAKLFASAIDDISYQLSDNRVLMVSREWRDQSFYPDQVLRKHSGHHLSNTYRHAV